LILVSIILEIFKYTEFIFLSLSLYYVSSYFGTIFLYTNFPKNAFNPQV
jgi:hypothetical protein